MKIIKMGNEPISVNTYELKCGYCGCIFTFEADEIIVQEHCLMGGAYTKCPCCNALVDFKSWTVL